MQDSTTTTAEITTKSHPIAPASKNRFSRNRRRAGIAIQVYARKRTVESLPIVQIFSVRKEKKRKCRYLALVWCNYGVIPQKIPPSGPWGESGGDQLAVIIGERGRGSQCAAIGYENGSGTEPDAAGRVHYYVQHGSLVNGGVAGSGGFPHGLSLKRLRGVPIQSEAGLSLVHSR